MSGYGIELFSTWSLQNVKIGTPYQRLLFISTRSFIWNSSPVSFFLAVCGSHSLMSSVVPCRKSFGYWWRRLLKGRVPQQLGWYGFAAWCFFATGAVAGTPSSHSLSALSHKVCEVSTNVSSLSSMSLTLDGRVCSDSSEQWAGCMLSPVNALPFLVPLVLYFPLLLLLLPLLCVS